MVPYLAMLGPVPIKLSGAVIMAPLFQQTNFRNMTNEGWLDARLSPAPWADFETDKFLLTVPTSWIYAYEDAESLLYRYNLGMDGVAEIFGYPIEKRNRGVHMLYLMPEPHIKAGAYGIDYPQVNTIYEPWREYNG